MVAAVVIAVCIVDKSCFCCAASACIVVTAAASESKDALTAVPYLTVLVEVLEQCFDRRIVAKLRYHAKQMLTFSGTFLDNKGYGITLLLERFGLKLHAIEGAILSYI